MIDLRRLWKKHEVMPVITVDGMSGKVISYGNMNKEAFAYTLKTRKVWYYHPDTGRVKMKGEHSGNYQKLMSIKTDHYLESLLVTVEQIGTACPHDGGHSTYFYHEIFDTDEDLAKRNKFGRVEVDEDFDFSKEDYDDMFED